MWKQETSAQDDTIDIGYVEEVLLWVDFLCVNQRNIAERNSQVAIIASTFEQASAVIGWLGGSNISQAASIMTRALNSSHYRCPDAPRPSILLVSKMLQAMAVLRTDSYWTRLWVVQEVVLARGFWMLCQDVFLSWNDYNNLSEYKEVLCRELVTVDESRRLSYDQLWQLEYVSQRHRIDPFIKGVRTDRSCDINTISESFEVFGRVSCMGARDRIYGMLGMLPMSKSILIRLD